MFSRISRPFFCPGLLFHVSPATSIAPQRLGCNCFRDLSVPSCGQTWSVRPDMRQGSRVHSSPTICWPVCPLHSACAGCVPGWGAGEYTQWRCGELLCLLPFRTQITVSPTYVLCRVKFSQHLATFLHAAYLITPCRSRKCSFRMLTGIIMNVETSIINRIPFHALMFKTWTMHARRQLSTSPR